MKKKQTIHHIIPQSRIHQVNTTLYKNHPDNLKKLSENIHRAFHILFSNQTPKEQLETWFKINHTVLSKYVKQELVMLFTLNDREFYK